MDCVAPCQTQAELQSWCGWWNPGSPYERVGNRGENGVFSSILWGNFDMEVGRRGGSIVGWEGLELHV